MSVWLCPPGVLVRTATHLSMFVCGAVCGLLRARSQKTAGVRLSLDSPFKSLVEGSSRQVVPSKKGCGGDLVGKGPTLREPVRRGGSKNSVVFKEKKCFVILSAVYIGISSNGSSGLTVFETCYSFTTCGMLY